MKSAKEYRHSSRPITFSNSLGGERIKFDPLDTSDQPTVKMYVCGLTPQDHAHLGHGLTSIRFDIIRRYLEYRRLNVNFVQNVTDIEDKIIEKSRTTGEDPMVMTARHTEDFYRSLESLNVLPVTTLTKVTQYVPQTISFVQTLIEKGMAYVTAEGSVYFDVRKKADYGKLSNQNTTMLFESVRKELDKEKHSPLDFALWKRDESSVLSYPSPWGIGRPGWHIECSVMAYETLGAQIDIHGGGLDLKFPHHENEIAQSEAFSNSQFAKIWLHSGLLNINGQKMSKSLNNFVKLSDGIELYGSAMMRFVVARQHYRSSIDLTAQLFRESLNSMLEFHRLFERCAVTADTAADTTVNEEVTELQSKFEQAMDNDINSPEGLVALEQARNKVSTALDKNQTTIEQAAPLVAAIRSLGNILGLFFESSAQFQAQGLHLISKLTESEPLTLDAINEIIATRKMAREQKDFARSDSLRIETAQRGVELLDGKVGATWRFA